MEAPDNSQYIDIHTHRDGLEAATLAVCSMEFDSTGIEAKLPVPCSIGRHPWQAAVGWHREESHALELLLARDECVALGEVGLDRVHGPGFEQQFHVLEAQLDVASSGRMPVIFHCVRAHADLMQLRKRRAAEEPWIIHGFSGHAELAGQLLRMDFHISFGAAVLATGGKAREALAQVPVDRLFFETDESGLDVSVIYRCAAEVLGMEVSELRNIISANYRSIFGTVK